MKNRFKYLDPLTGQLPWWPYPHSANGTLWRARSLLFGRSVGDIDEIATEAESLIYTFFEVERDQAIAQITADKRFDLLEDSGGGRSEFRLEALEEYSINTRDNTTQVEALDQALSNMFDPSNLKASDVREYECLAGFAMIKLQDFLKQANYTYDPKSRKLLRKSESEVRLFDYSFAASFLLEAQDAVGRGELRRATARLSQKYEEKIGKLQNRQNLHAEIRAEILEQERQRRQEESTARNDSRHESNRQVKAKVLGWFAEDPAKFPSAEKAAKYFCSKLSEENIEREQRTVADWIRAYAKDNGMRWRA